MITSKKLTAVMLSAVMAVMMMPQSAFAAYGADREQIVSEKVANEIEEITGTEDINKNIEETADGFEVDGENVDITLPEEGDGNIVMDSEEESIGMGLPEEVQGEEGILTDDGTVIYGATEDVSVAVQAGEEEQDGETFEFTRALVTIENADAPKEYSFKLDLPEGYKVVTAKEYAKCYANKEEKSLYAETGAKLQEVYILNNDNNLVQIIDPAWAKDANGNDVNTYYEIKGDELVQVVNFDEDTAFPVVADPETHLAGWRITSKDKTPSGTAYGSWIEGCRTYIKSSSNSKTIGISRTISLNNNVSGTLHLGNDIIAGSVGVSLSTSSSTTISYSESLKGKKAGTYALEWRRVFSNYNVVQTQYIRIDGLAYPTSTKATAHVHKYKSISFRTIWKSTKNIT